MPFKSNLKQKPGFSKSGVGWRSIEVETGFIVPCVEVLNLLDNNVELLEKNDD